MPWLFAPVMALIPPLIMWAAVRCENFAAESIFCRWSGVLSHLALDWTNAYGIRLFLPFSSRWLRLDMTDVVDPWILVVLLLAVAAPALSRLVNAEIGSRVRARSAARLGLVCAAGAARLRRRTLHRA